ncbi:MAG TPA: hypothetical protein VNO82_20840 [Solirubrobacteraceae bacterium]|nr:hypothetical protein [Solirubrobacteraceae bacterium]
MTEKPEAPPKRGDAAWRAHRDAIANRNERATRLAQAKRHEKYERLVARERQDELRERAELSKRPH